MRSLPRGLLFAVICLGAGGAPAGAGGVISGRVVLTRGDQPSDPAELVVYLEDLPAPEKRTAPDGGQALIAQQNEAFTPGLTVIQRGSTIGFPNMDKVFHNVFSLSAAKKFDLGLYKSGASKSVTFEEPGTVDVFCNIHPGMIAKIFVVDSAFVARPASNGTFSLSGVPPGEHRLVVWQPSGSPSSMAVKVSSGQTVDVEVKLVASNTPSRHLRKDGTPYGRYK